MKRPGRTIIVSLIVASIVIALGTYILLRIEGLPGAGKLKTLRAFSFSSASDLDAWDKKLLAKKYTDYSIAEHDGKKCVKAVSEDSASTLFYKQKLSYRKAPFLSWDWRAEKFPSGKKKETLKEKDEFDFVGQVYVIFYARFFLNAKAIQYVWTREVPVGTVSDSPYTKKVKLLVLESGPTDQWKHEKRNIKEDFEELFGEELRKDVMAIAFMTDSDSTDSDAIAYFSNIKFGYLQGIEDVPGQEKKGVFDFLRDLFSRLTKKQ